MGGALCSQLVQWREEMCSCFKYTCVLYFLTPTTTNSLSSPTSQCIHHGFQGSVPQVCPHCRGQSQMGCSSYPHFCPTTRSGILSDPLLRVDNFTRITHIHKWMDKEDGLHVYKGIWLSHSKGWILTTYIDLDGTGVYYTEWNTAVRERQVYGFTPR